MALEMLREGRATLHLGGTAADGQQILASEALLLVLDHLVRQTFLEPLECVSPLEQD